jgi:hypothetical protein
MCYLIELISIIVHVYRTNHFKCYTSIFFVDFNCEIIAYALHHEILSNAFQLITYVGPIVIRSIFIHDECKCTFENIQWSNIGRTWRLTIISKQDEFNQYQHDNVHLLNENNSFPIVHMYQRVHRRLDSSPSSSMKTCDKSIEHAAIHMYISYEFVDV